MSILYGASVVDFGEGSEIEVGHAVGAEGDYLVADLGGFFYKAGDVYSEAGVAEWGKVGYATVDVVDRAPVVLQAELVEADSDAEDALVDVADGARLDHPDLFERFVLLEVFALVELFEASIK